MNQRNRKRPPQKGGNEKKQRGPRLAAAHMLARVLDKSIPLDAVLASGMQGISGKDRAFARALVSTTLRNLGVIDHILEGRLNTPISHRAHIARDALRLGVCEVLFLRTPTHAAVSEAVNLTGTHTTSRPLRGVVNAVMRRVGTEAESLLEHLDQAKLNTPDWLYADWVKAYGDETAHAIATAHATEPKLDLSTKEDAAALAGRVDGTVIGPNTVRLPQDHPPVETLPGYDSGAFWVQDFAATLPVRLMGDVAGKTVLDMCAAPGGKTMQLAARGAEVLAVDKAEPRLDRLAQNLERTGLPADLLCTDAADLQGIDPFDIVLLDAPCSATGTIRRHPDLPWIREEGAMNGMTRLQDKLLDRAAALTQPGGMLVYAVCSLEPREGEERIDAFLKRHTKFARRPVSADEIAPTADAITPKGDVRTLPCHLGDQGGMDGFFIARLIREG